MGMSCMISALERMREEKDLDDIVFAFMKLWSQQPIEEREMYVWILEVLSSYEPRTYKPRVRGNKLALPGAKQGVRTLVSRVVVFDNTIRYFTYVTPAESTTVDEHQHKLLDLKYYIYIIISEIVTPFEPVSETPDAPWIFSLKFELF